jgi:hypothetical protein
VAAVSGTSGVRAVGVGAQHVGQHERVEVVVSAPGAAVAQSQRPDLSGADHEYCQARGEPGVDHGAVTAFDPDRGDLVLLQAPQRLA